MHHPYTDVLMDHFMHPRNSGVLPDAHGCGTANHHVCGDVTRIFVRVEDGRIAAITFQAHGCGPGIACASWLTEKVKDQPVQAAAAISSREMGRALGLPSEKLHCAWLALKALQGALQEAAARGGTAPLPSTVEPAEGGDLS